MKAVKSLLQLILVACISSSVLGQITKDSIKKRMWESGDPDFEITEVPEKWKNESAVILCKSYDFEYSLQLKTSKIYQDQYLRKRIKILDKYTLDKYSKFILFEEQKDFSWSRDGVFFGVKIIKPDGTEIKIEIDEAVQMKKFKNSKEKRIMMKVIKNSSSLNWK